MSPRPEPANTKICPECAHTPHPSGLRWAPTHPAEATHCRDCGAELWVHGMWKNAPVCPCSRAECEAEREREFGDADNAVVVGVDRGRDEGKVTVVVNGYDSRALR